MTGIFQKVGDVSRKKYAILRIIVRLEYERGVLPMPLSPQEMIRLLKNNGFAEVSQNGSHLKLYNEKNKRTVIVPCHAIPKH